RQRRGVPARLALVHGHGPDLALPARVAGPEEDRVPLRDPDTLARLGRLEVLEMDALTRLEPVDAAHRRDVDEDTARHDALAHPGDGEVRRAEHRVDELRGTAVVGRAVPEDVGERVDVRDVHAME